jgi:hypothetical protein
MADCLSARRQGEWTRLQGHSDPKAWQAAVDAFSSGHVYEVARCQWRLAEALLSRGDREHATTAAKAAYQTAVGLGAQPLQSALEALARRGVWRAQRLEAAALARRLGLDQPDQETPQPDA